MSRRRAISGEDGFTLVELMVALAGGMVVLFAVTSFIMISLRHSTEVSARVDANQQARSALYLVMDELHSACVAPQIAPVGAGSDDTSLSFIHQRGSAVTPVPVLSKLTLNGGTLSQTDYPVVGGTSPNWTFSSSASASRELATNISPSGANSGIFTYFAYNAGQVSSTQLPTPLSATSAAHAVAVGVAFTAASSSTPINDPDGPVDVQDTALLRFSPTSYSESVTNLPCQ